MYVVDESADEPIMLINKHIGYDETDGGGIIGSDFARELLYLDSLGKKRIQVWINSPGGTVLDGYDIYSALLKTKTKIDTYCTGIAASIAAVIFQAGRNRIMCDYGILMYHNPFGGENTAGLEAMRNSIVTMIASRCQMNVDDVTEMMNRETFIMSDEALKLKLCDSIEVSTDLNRKRIQPPFEAVQDRAHLRSHWAESNKVLNSIFQTTTDMKKVTNKLGLTEAANEDAICTGIDGIVNRATAAEAKAEALQKEMDALKAKMQTDQAAMNDLTNKLNALEQKKKDDDAKALADKAKNMIKTLGVDKGRVKNEAAAIAKWEARAVANFEDTQDALESLPVNKASINIIDEADKKNKIDNQDVMSVENAVAQDMARIRNRWNKRQLAD